MPKKKERSPTDTFPKTLQECIVYFANPDNALRFMVSIRWPNGITCPRCKSDQHTFISTRRTWQCKACKKMFTVKLGTVMEDSPIGLDKWLCAMWMIVNDKNGVSSWEVHRALDITQKSAWFLLHRLRLAMQNGSFDMLAGQVEADETFVGGKLENMHQDRREQFQWIGPATNKTIVMGILERSEEDDASQIYATVVPDRTGDILQNELYANVEVGSEVITDEHGGYNGLDEWFTHSTVNHSAKEYVNGHVHTNGIENFWTLLKRAIRGTYVSVENDHLFRYLDEQTFRFNERDGDGNDRERFIKAAGQIAAKRLTYKQLIDRGGALLPRRGRLPKLYAKSKDQNPTTT